MIFVFANSRFVLSLKPKDVSLMPSSNERHDKTVVYTLRTENTVITVSKWREIQSMFSESLYFIFYIDDLDCEW